jgi:hypothetical protein
VFFLTIHGIYDVKTIYFYLYSLKWCLIGINYLEAEGENYEIIPAKLDDKLYAELTVRITDSPYLNL